MTPILFEKDDYVLFAFPLDVAQDIDEGGHGTEDTSSDKSIRSVKCLLHVTRSKGKFEVVSPMYPPYSTPINQVPFAEERILGETARKYALANLGKQPPKGSVFGVSINFPLKQDKIKPFKEVFFYRDMTPKEYKHLISSVEDFHQWLLSKKIRIDWPFLEIHEGKGRYAGEYQVKVKDDEVYQIVRLHPKLKEDELPDYDPIIAHEIGHAIWYQLLSNRAKAKWVELFTQYCKPIPVTKEDLVQFRDGVLALRTPTPIDDFLEDLEDDEADKFDQILAYFEEVYHLKTEHLEYLIQGRGDLEKLWPQSVTRIFEAETPISDYAMKNPEEFWCEALAYYYTHNELLPGEVRNLMERTLKNLEQAKKSRITL